MEDFYAPGKTSSPFKRSFSFRDMKFIRFSFYPPFQFY